MSEKTEVETFFDDFNDDIHQEKPSVVLTVPEKKTDEEPPKKEEEEEENEEELKLERSKPKPKPTNEESNGILRKKLDQAESELKTFKEKFSSVPAEAITPYIEYLEKVNDGVIDADAAKKVIEEIEAKDVEIVELRQKLEEKEKRVSEIDVRYSDEFKSKYEEPYKAAANTMLLEFASVSPDKKLIAPNATKKLHDYLAQNSDKIDAMEVKAKLQEYKQDFKEETNGEDVSLPSVTSMMQSVRAFNKAKSDMHEAYTTWGSKKKQDQEQRLAEEERQRDLAYKAGRRERSTLASKAYKDYDIDTYDFIKEDELKEIVQEEFKFGEKVMQGADVPPYDTLITRGVNSRLWEKHRDNYLRLLKEEEQREPKKGSRLQTNTTKQTKSWLDD